MKIGKLLGSTTRSSGRRDATGPGWGGARAFLLSGSVAGFVGAWIHGKTGDADLAGAGAEAAGQVFDLGLGVLVGGVFGLIEAGRKQIQNLAAGS